MTTHAMIGLEEPSGLIIAIHVSGDGGLHDDLDCGPMLHQHYQDEAKIRQLLELGACGWVGPEIGQQHDPLDPRHIWTVALRRDHGLPETPTNGTRVFTERRLFLEAADRAAAYVYLWNGRAWLYYNEDTEAWIPLAEAVAAMEPAAAQEMTVEDYLHWRADCADPTRLARMQEGGYVYTAPQLRDPICLPDIAARIGVPVEQWAGNCYAIASLLLKHNIVGGTLHYGHWNGPVAAGSMFYGRPLVPHGWVVTDDPDYRIVDPTRWEFWQEDPFIYAGPEADWYDSGGQAWITATRKEPPAYTPGARPSSLRLEDAVIHSFVDTLLKNPPGWTEDHDFWLANLPIAALAPFAREIYQALRDGGQESYIPMDNARLVMQELPTNLHRRG